MDFLSADQTRQSDGRVYVAHPRTGTLHLWREYDNLERGDRFSALARAFREGSSHLDR